MTKFLFRISFFSLFLSTLFLTSCDEDVTLPGGPSATPPSVSLLPGSDLISSDTDLDANSDFMVQLSASQGDALMNSLQIFENGVELETARMFINGAAAAANPILIVPEDEKASFTYDITITGLPAGVNNYSFEVTDVDGEVGATSVNVTGISEPLAISLQQSGNIDNATPGSLVAIPVTVTQGSALVSELSVTSAGTLLDPSDLAFLEANAGTTFTTNPLTLDEASQTGFDGSVYIRAGSGDGAYTITVTDASGGTASVDVVINASTPVTGEFTAVVLNNNSGPREGGLDLYNGVAVSTVSQADRAQLEDQGIDNDLDFAENWLQELAPVNGARLRLAGSNQPEGFGYDSVNSQEAIVAAFESAGNDLDNSGKLAQGDILLVNSGDDYFILQIASINLTTNDNLDSYEINIKQAIR